jgi:predicted nucleic-acid-binding Zn-ribbon protein
MKSEVYESYMKQYILNIEEYKLKHELCPKCGYKSHSSTLMGYIFNTAKPDQAIFRCICSNCGDTHTYQDRISTQEFRERKLNDLDV